MKKYVLRDRAPQTVHDELAEHPEILRDLLHARGISSRSGAADFLAPSFERDSHDPFLLPDMEKAVDRILKGIANGERIAIWSDYDCDGIPGGAMLHDFFKLIGYEHFTNYIPHRHEEGYGLNSKGIEKLKGEGVGLIITVDSGITDHAPVERANELGIDVIVTDHHLPKDTLPPAFAVINPKRADNTYPFDGLAGAGVAWKLAQGILAKNRFGVPEGREKWLLDLVGIATIADMMPLLGENRALAHFGLLVLRKSPRPGLMKLLKLLRTNQRTLTEEDIGFTIGPRINAASRMDVPQDAFHLLTTRDEAEGERLAKHLNRMNDVRKGVVAAMVKEIRERLTKEGMPDGLVVLGNPAWRPGLLGLVAQNIVQEYGRAVCLWGREGGDTIKGSCRSDGTVNVVELMQATRESFLDFGGHRFSGGFALAEEHVHTIRSRFEKAYAQVRNGEAVEDVFIDRELDIMDASATTLAHLRRLAPFGEANPKPLFSLPNAMVTGVRAFGKTGNHLEVTFTRGASSLKGISFFQKPEDFTSVPREGLKADVIAHLEADFFAGGRPRLRLVDLL